MHLIINNLSKRFASEWIIRDFSLELRPGSPVALTGPNGSGKSTLLQMAAGYMPPTTGTVTYHMAGKPVSPDDVFKYIGIAAPYMELIEEFTLPELINFHNTFKPLAPELNAKAFAERLQIGFFPGKPVKNYSSGMKQRVKLGLALFSDTPLLLDEPSANLDAAGLAWYVSEILQQVSTRTILICSNQPEEYSFCKEVINTASFRK